MVGFYSEMADGRWGLYHTSNDYVFRDIQGTGLYRLLEVKGAVRVNQTLYYLSFSERMPEFLVWSEDTGLNLYH